ncbi:MAG TPA: bifunctional diaminohydroxyphosphoribosylaminopyrimidine deaminase/5-amino-6-(5-phosphoribosylamino)uracil reductase RibD [Beijerinckiaceae bacterium]|nr:bifunctional diaminohydroxyphosphoribosylaminopyrimidine deaminase/5-amino-6-(5-phosphoribosylamino)uracil reductase RibD [Beijerinckiaceae bacterium]
MTSADDERFMRQALALGARHLGLTWPNPSVGAVVVAPAGDGPRIVAQGITQPGGRPHAEPIALAAAGAAARGATLYVSLEPCSHHGRSSPCVDVIVASGVARVVSALEDPDPRVSGRGHTLIAAAGMAVTNGVLAGEASRLHCGHILRVTQRRPAVTLKIAQTADGYAARASGPRLLITGDLANARTHLMRAHADAVLVGVGTILSDDPRLTVRLPGLEKRSPIRVVFDSRLRTPQTAYVVRTARDIPTWIVTAMGEPDEPERRLTEAGVTVMRVEGDETSRIGLLPALRLLAEQGVTRVFSEGGPSLGGALAAAGLLDEIVLVTSGSALAEQGVPALTPPLQAALQTTFRHVGRETAGADRFDTFERLC